MQTIFNDVRGVQNHCTSKLILTDASSALVSAVIVGIMSVSWFRFPLSYGFDEPD